MDEGRLGSGSYEWAVLMAKNAVRRKSWPLYKHIQTRIGIAWVKLQRGGWDVYVPTDADRAASDWENWTGEVLC